MFHSISWQGYWTALALLTAAYYLVVYLLYFRAGFPAFGALQPRRPAPAPQPAPGSTKEPAGGPVQPGVFSSPGDFQAPPEGSEEAVVYACMDELNAYFEEARRSKCVKLQVVYALQQILKKYPSLKTSPFKDSLTAVLVSQAETLCSVRLSAADTVRLWEGW